MNGNKSIEIYKLKKKKKDEWEPEPLEVGNKNKRIIYLKKKNEKLTLGD
jgi:hypothetical protein